MHMSLSPVSEERRCTGDGQHWTVDDFQAKIEQGHIEAIAKAVAFAFSSNDPAVCVAAVSVDTYVG